MSTITTPASLTDALDRLGALDRLIRVREWEKAAILATFVRLDGDGNRKTCSPAEFAARGIAGLRTQETVRMYVGRWLEQSNGRYPKPGSTVQIPDVEWARTRTGTDGHSSTEGMTKTLDRIIEAHGADAVADRLADKAPGAVSKAADKPAVRRETSERHRAELEDAGLSNAGQGLLDTKADADARRLGTGDLDAQELIRQAKDVIQARVHREVNRLPATQDLRTALVHLIHVAQGWLDAIDGTATWTDNDIALAAELGIDLEGVR